MGQGTSRQPAAAAAASSSCVRLVLPLVLLAPLAYCFDWQYEMALSSIEKHKLRDIPTPIGTDHLRPIPASELLELHWRGRGMLQQRDQNLTDPGMRRLIRRKCRGSRGEWCGLYELQPGLPYRPAPRGNKTCPNDCNGVGNCNYDTGLCDCPAGWTGQDCSSLLQRPCTNRYRDSGNVTATHTDSAGRDLDWTKVGWMASRCPGVCDATVAACYCDGPKYGHIPPPLGSPPGTPPIKQGRMLGDHCNPKQTPEGEDMIWGNTDLNALYGPQGWCMAPAPLRSCGCYMDGHHGAACEMRHEMHCPNQCSGRGDCWLGFCKCHAGWYGLDCMRKVAGAEVEPVTFPVHQRHLEAVVETAPEALPQPPGGALRKRPLIYVYDVPPEYTTRMLQYKVQRLGCVHRHWDAGNNLLQQTNNLYGLEPYLHETLLGSEHRTFDPDQADFFYVPAYICCLIYPVYSWADYPWWYGPLQLRVLHASNMLLELKRYIQSTYPFWNRTQGRDHIWLANHDEGACWFPSEIYNTSIILTHWGRMDLNHESNSAYDWDNYSRPMQHHEWQPQDWRGNYLGHACYTPGKDLVIPSFKWPQHYSDSPFMGAEPRNRTTLLYFKGDMGDHRLEWYSRRIRQKLYSLSKQYNWAQKYNILLGNTADVAGGYSEGLASSRFCLVSPGDGWSSRAEDAVLHGCIPVIIMDQVHAVFESILDYDAFSIRIKEEALEHVPQILLAVPEDRVLRMQRRLSRVWPRFAYNAGKAVRSVFVGQLRGSARDATASERLLQDDAFGTIMQWLYSKTNKDRPSGGP